MRCDISRRPTPVRCSYSSRSFWRPSAVIGIGDRSIQQLPRKTPSGDTAWTKSKANPAMQQRVARTSCTGNYTGRRATRTERGEQGTNNRKDTKNTKKGKLRGD